MASTMALLSRFDTKPRTNIAYGYNLSIHLPKSAGGDPCPQRLVT
jgi:hypothetical protein